VQDSLLQYFAESEVAFDHFVIQMPSGVILQDGQPIKLEPQILTFLLLLIKHRDHIVSRDKIVAQVWGDKKASDDAIRALVKKLRIALGDNARAPKFLKTIPLQGYLFIMPVKIEFHQADWWRSKRVIYSISAVAIILITLFVQAQFETFTSNERKPEREVIISTITQMKGSEVSPYLSTNDRLLFSHRGINDKSLQLYVKELNWAVSKRVTWDSADYVDGIFSSDASQAIVKRKSGNQESLWIFNFDVDFNVLSAQPITLDEAVLLQSISAISYSQDDTNLYLFGEAKTNSESITAVEGQLSRQVQAANFGLIRYNIESEQLVVLALPVPIGSQVMDAKESVDGEFLAVLIRGEKHADIYVQELSSKETKLVKRVPLLSTSLVWAADGGSITFSTEAGELLNLNISKRRLYRWSNLPVKATEVVSQCGEYCFVIKEREADLINIVERPFVFNKQSYIGATQFPATSNDRFPTYFNDGKGIYFLSLSSDALSIKRYIDGKGVEVIYTLPKTSNINSFVLSPDENYFAGELDGRIFLYSLNMGTLSFLTSGKLTTSNPVWISDDVLFYQQNENNRSVIYAHDIVSNKVEVKAKGFQFIKPLNNKQWLLVDEKSQAYLYPKRPLESGEYVFEVPVFSVDMLNESTKFADLESLNNSGFQVVDNALFFISVKNGLYILNKMALATGEIESLDLGLQSVLRQFDIHPDMQKMLLVESSLAQNNLLRVNGLTLATRQFKQVVTETP
jgi:DNA-binding winged helix-turn-helix (wHTH) protein/sugar lactone lactonase YvrE